MTASVESADLSGARWLLDGTAAHAAARYRDARAIESYDAYLASVIDVAKTQSLPLTDSSATALSRLAVYLLIQRADESFVEVGSRRQQLWRCIQTFGLPLEGFLELFEAHRAEVAPILPSDTETTSPSKDGKIRSSKEMLPEGSPRNATLLIARPVAGSGERPGMAGIADEDESSRTRDAEAMALASTAGTADHGAEPVGKAPANGLPEHARHHRPMLPLCSSHPGFELLFS